MQRRKFISLLGGAVAAWPLSARGQFKMARIGALYIGLADEASFKTALREGLRELGYVEGQNIAFEFRSAEGKLDRLPELAAELVRIKVDVIVALYVPSALAAKQATREIPIVAIAADPVENGHRRQLGASGRKYYRRVVDVCRIECKKHRTVPRHAAVSAARGGIGQR
jgi:putative tryptophan/tyrosine transport system substrate-binding protein